MSHYWDLAVGRQGTSYWLSQLIVNSPICKHEWGLNLLFTCSSTDKKFTAMHLYGFKWMSSVYFCCVRVHIFFRFFFQGGQHCSQGVVFTGSGIHFLKVNRHHPRDASQVELINLIRASPSLCDSSCLDHNHRVLMQNLWQESFEVMTSSKSS